MTSDTITLHVRKEYFNQILSGEKTFEFRKVSDYWTNRLSTGLLKHIVIMCGYPRNEELDKMIFLPWRGYKLTQITHKEFGNDPIIVYAIRLTEKAGAP
jgi:hypothetical protein